MRRIAAAVVAVVAIAAPMIGLTPPRAGGAQAPPPIVLRSIPAWVPSGGDLPLGVTLSPDADSVVVEVYGALGSRSAYERALDGRALTSPISRVTIPATAVTTTANGDTIVVGLQPPDAPRDDQRLQVRRTGVYPMRLQARQGDRPMGDVVTQLVVVDPSNAPVGVRLGVAWVWSLSTAPAYLPDGRPDPGVVSQWRPDGRIGRLADSLARYPAVPLTLAPSPEMLESWSAIAADDAELTGTLAEVRAASTPPHQTLASHYVPLDLPSLLAYGLGDRVPGELAAGADVLAGMAGRVDPRTAVVNPVDTAALGELRGAGVDRVVVSSGSLNPIDERFTNATPFALDADGRRFSAVASNDSLVALLGGSESPAVRAQRFLGWCTTVALEQPNAKRGVTAALPPGFDLPGDTADAVLAGLAFNPFLEPMTLDTLFDRLVPAKPTVRTLRPSVPARPSVTASEMNATEAELDAFESLAGTDDPIAVRGRRVLLAVLTTFWTNDRARAKAELQSISTAIDGFVANVRTPTNRTVTITARRARLPVAILNGTGKTLRVRVSVRSDKLFFPAGSEQIVDLPPRASTVTFVVETRASGTFPLEVDVDSADGALALTSSRLTVRSTVVSGVGVFLTVGAAAFLAGWWTLHARRVRRGRRDAAHS